MFLPTDLVLMPPQTPSDTIQTSTRHPQTPSRHHPDTLRHHPDTPKHRRFYATEGTGRKGNIRVWPISNFANWFGIATSWDLLSPQTHSRHQADTPRHNPDTPSYRSFCKKGHWKKRQYLSFMTFYKILHMDLVLIHPRHPETPSSLVSGWCLECAWGGLRMYQYQIHWPIKNI